MALFPVAALVVVVGAIFGIQGLLANPIVSVSPSGLTTLSGSFAGVSCDRGCVQGYVEAGARSVFVRLPRGCPQPPADRTVTLTGRPDPSLGSGAYLATGCATAAS
jgi:hypothetical protein